MTTRPCKLCGAPIRILESVEHGTVALDTQQDVFRVTEIEGKSVAVLDRDAHVPHAKFCFGAMHAVGGNNGRAG